MEQIKVFYSITILLFFTSANVYAQHGFPDGHFCNTEEGWNCKECQALWAAKYVKDNQVIVVPHRGLWGEKNIPESSLSAIRKAYEAKYMFCEIDVVLTKDRKLILTHDMQLNRTTNAPPTFSTDGGVIDPGDFVRSLNYQSETIGSVPDANGEIYPSFPALKNILYKDAFNNITTEKIETIESAFDFCKDKEIILAIDIKTVNFSDLLIRKEYFEVIKIILESAKSRNILHKIILKIATAGQVPIKELKQELELQNLWIDFSTKTNVVYINIVGAGSPLATNKEYIDGIIALPSLIAIEHIYKNSKDLLLLPNKDFDNMSIIEYTKDKGKRTGVFHPIPADKSGSPSGRGSYYNPPNFGTLNDLRGSLEFLFGVGEKNMPTIIVTDQPDNDSDFLKVFNIFSKYTKRDF